MQEKKLRYFLLTCFCLSVFFCRAQEKITLTGHISDRETGASLFMVNVEVPSKQAGTLTDKKGRYSLSLPRGEYTLTISYLGYESISKKIDLTENRVMDFKLSPSSESLKGITLTTNNLTETLRSPQMSVVAVSPTELKKIPVVLGEADVVKSLLLLPGITNGGEASSGFNVRGGSADQNLILLDQATLYNPSHLFGFFSVFNPDALKSVKLYKGGIPARYGGRASSVLDLKQRTGNPDQFKVNGSVGVVSAKLLAEGPIIKDKSSFLVAGRSSYAHLFLKLADNPNSAYFYDLNTKLDYELDDQNTLYFSGYYGRDVFNVNDSFKINYGNAVANLHWNHTFSEDFSADLHFIYSNFDFDLTIDPVGFTYQSGIKNLNIKYDFQQKLSDDVKLNYGFASKYFFINPGYLKPSRDDSGFTERQFTKKYAWQNGVYLQAQQDISAHLAVDYGLRVNTFNRLGQRKINGYVNDNPVLYNPDRGLYEEAPILSSYSKSRGTTIKSYLHLEPRFSVSYKFKKNNAFKASYQRMHQYMQLLTNNNSPTPFNVWVPSGNYVKPLRADQYAFGYFRDIERSNLRLETEVFYKKFKNSIDYINGADLITNDAVERVILDGEARAYGLEVLLRKTSGKLTGWIAYTLSNAEQKTPGRTPQEPGINQGDWYPLAWDKTHDISVTANYELNKKWRFGATFVYQTGQPVTYPVGQYHFNGQTIPDYGTRNANRLPSFHHLDISATLTPKTDRKKPWKGKWVFSIYNVYDRQNAATIRFAENEDTGVNEATRLSIFGIIPSVSYQFSF